MRLPICPFTLHRIDFTVGVFIGCNLSFKEAARDFWVVTVGLDSISSLSHLLRIAVCTSRGPVLSIASHTNLLSTRFLHDTPHKFSLRITTDSNTTGFKENLITSILPQNFP